MKYVSIDIETTGLNPDACKIIEFAAVYDDTDYSLKHAPSFHKLILPNEIRGELFAIQMNGEIFKEIQENFNSDLVTLEKDLVDKFAHWLGDLNLTKPTFAGKNFANFDLRFLRRLPGWQNIKHEYRFIDVGSMYLQHTDKWTVPSLSDCLERANIEKSVTHRALDDALDVCRLIRAKLLGKK